MRMIERRIGADALEFPDADMDRGRAGIVLEVRDDGVGHCSFLGSLDRHNSGGAPSWVASH